MNHTSFDLAEEEIADAIADKAAYFSNPEERNLVGLEFLLGAAATLGSLFLYSFIEEANKQAKRLGKLSARKLGDVIADYLKNPNAKEEHNSVRKKASETAKKLAPAEFDIHLATAQSDIFQSLIEAGLPETSAQAVAKKTAAAMAKALKESLKTPT
ncbi:MAG: hypothetical protein V4525_05620 [Pseudomonadota bacterium]